MSSAAALLLTTLGLLLLQGWNDSLTYDEVRYVWSGACAARTGIDPAGLHDWQAGYNQPLGFRLLSGAAVAVTDSRTRPDCTDPRSFFSGGPDRLRLLTLVARLPTIAIALALVFVTGAWAWQVYGAAAGFAAGILSAFEPLLLGHGHLAGTDLPLTAGIVLCLYGHWRWHRGGRMRWLLLAGLGLGLGLSAKVIALELLPILVAIELAPRRAPSPGPRPRPVLGVMVPTLVAWASLCLVYLLPVRAAAPGLARKGPLDLLLPPPWLYSLQYQLGRAGDSAVNYMNGTVFRGAAPLYFLEAWALKVTLGLLVLGLAGLALALYRRDRFAALYLLLPIGMILAVPSAGKLLIGARYILPAVPLAVILAASLLSEPRARNFAWTCIVALSLVPSLLAQPRDIGYFNPIALGRPDQFLSDSNLDWGQDMWRLRDWWQAHGRPRLATDLFGSLGPAAYGIQSQQVREPYGFDKACDASYVAVSETQLTVYGTAGEDLRGMVPVARLGTGVLVYGGAACGISIG
ncbi:MAG: phospholipid carrier-dependent glycosyltransferase [Candidatus Dormibacteria bacterium]